MYRDVVESESEQLPWVFSPGGDYPLPDEWPIVVCDIKVDVYCELVDIEQEHYADRKPATR